MRIAALILGVLGGVFGIVAALFALAVGGIGSAVGAESAGTVVGGSLAAFGFSLVGIVGGAVAIAKPKLAASLMLIGAIGGTICVFVAFIVPGPLLLIGSLFAFLGRTASSNGEKIAASSPPVPSTVASE